MFVDLTICTVCGMALGFWRPPLRMCPICERLARAALGESDQEAAS